MNQPVRTPAVAIVGAGPSGLRAAAELAATPRRRGARPRPRGRARWHSRATAYHPGYGIRDLRPVHHRPSVRRGSSWIGRRKAGADIVTRAMVTGWAGRRPRGHLAAGTVPGGRPKATILATGARERPRSRASDPRGPARRGLHHRRAAEPGAPRPPEGRHPGRRRRGRAGQLVGRAHPPARRLRTVAGDHRVPQPRTSTGCSPPSARPFFRTRVATTTRVARVIGHGRVRASRSRTCAPGTARWSPATPSCSPVTGSPTTNWPASGGIALDPHTLGPPVDTALRTAQGRASSPSATSSTRSTPPTAQPSTAPTSRRMCCSTSTAGSPRRPVSTWPRARGSGGYRPRGSGPATPARPVASCCCGPTSSATVPLWLRGRTGVRSEGSPHGGRQPRVGSTGFPMGCSKGRKPQPAPSRSRSRAEACGRGPPTPRALPHHRSIDPVRQVRCREGRDGP